MEIKHLGVSLSIRRVRGGGGREKRKKERAKGEKENGSSSPCCRTKKGEKITPSLFCRLEESCPIRLRLETTIARCAENIAENFSVPRVQTMGPPSLVQTHPAITVSSREELGPTNSKMASVEDIRTRVTLQEHGVINVS